MHISSSLLYSGRYLPGVAPESSLLHSLVSSILDDESSFINCDKGHGKSNDSGLISRELTAFIGLNVSSHL